MRPQKLITKRLTLKPYRPEDEDKFVEIVMDKISIQFMGGATGIEEEERKLFRKIAEIYEKNEERIFWIWGIYKKDQLCGHLELKESIHTGKDELEVVYMVHPNERRKGIMSETMSFLKQNQEIWGKRIIATVSPHNVYSLALLEKWGVEKTEVLLNEETEEEYFKLTLSK